MTALAVLVAPLWAQGEEPKNDEAEEPEIPEEIVLEGTLDPSVHEGRIHRGERDAPAAFVRLREGGVLEWKSGDAWNEVTLEGLGTILGTTRDRHELAQRQRGSSAEELPRKPTSLFLSLEAAAGVPWQHVQWVLTIATERKLRNVELSERKRRLIVLLPEDAAIEYSADYKPPPEVRVEIHIMARVEQPAKWGDVEILRPTETRYRYGEAPAEPEEPSEHKETADLAEATEYLRKTRKAGEDRKDPRVAFYGQIKAGHKVPYGRVFDVMEAFVEAGIESVDFFGTAIPPKDVRAAKRLPYPTKNYG